MPWDGTELWVADLVDDGDGARGRPTPGVSPAVAPNRSPSPSGTPTAACWFVSDRRDWWNLYRIGAGPVAEGRGRRRGRADPDGRDRGRHRRPGLGVRPEPLRLPARRADRRGLRRRRGRSPGGRHRTRPDRPSVLVDRGPDAVHDALLAPHLRPRAGDDRRLTVDASRSSPSPTSQPHGDADLRRRPARPATSVSTRPGSRPPVRSTSPPPAAPSPTPSSTRRPTPRRAAPDGEAPPLLVMIHGGPTSAARPQLSLGPAVLDLPGLRGGRRELPRQHRVRPGLPRPARRRVGHRRRRGLRRGGRAPRRPRACVDPNRLAIRGGSAGGFTRAVRAHLPRPASRPAPATTASPTSRRWPATPTSSRPATSTRSSGPTRRRATATSSARRSTTSTSSTARSSSSRASRTRSCRRRSPR